MVGTCSLRLISGCAWSCVHRGLLCMVCASIIDAHDDESVHQSELAWWAAVACARQGAVHGWCMLIKKGKDP